VRKKLAYGATGAVVWGAMVFMIGRYVLGFHSTLGMIMLTTFAALLGGISAYNAEKNPRE
jgi:hypothetical protein